ncbi:hypothetical protein MTO96_013504 [Rhipicephalus appendiculatus]
MNGTERAGSPGSSLAQARSRRQQGCDVTRRGRVKFWEEEYFRAPGSAAAGRQCARRQRRRRSGGRPSQLP